MHWVLILATPISKQTNNIQKGKGCRHSKSWLTCTQNDPDLYMKHKYRLISCSAPDIPAPYTLKKPRLKTKPTGFFFLPRELRQSIFLHLFDHTMLPINKDQPLPGWIPHYAYWQTQQLCLWAAELRTVHAMLLEDINYAERRWEEVMWKRYMDLYLAVQSAMRRGILELDQDSSSEAKI